MSEDVSGSVSGLVLSHEMPIVSPRVALCAWERGGIGGRRGLASAPIRRESGAAAQLINRSRGAHKNAGSIMPHSPEFWPDATRDESFVAYAIYLARKMKSIWI